MEHLRKSYVLISIIFIVKFFICNLQATSLSDTEDLEFNTVSGSKSSRHNFIDHVRRAIHSKSNSSSKLYIQATAIHVDKAEFPLTKLSFKLTLKLALEAIERKLASRRVSISLNVRSAGTCSHQYAAALAAEEYYTRRSRLFILSGCDDAIKSVSRLASSWRVPLMTAAGFRAELDDKTAHNTLTRVAFSLRTAVEFLVRILRSFKWRRVNLIVDESDSNSFALKESIEANVNNFKSEEFSVTLNVLSFDMLTLLSQSGENERKLNSSGKIDDKGDQWPNEATERAIRDILRQSSMFSKVNIVLIPQIYLRRFMLSVDDQKMANGHYTFINIPLLSLYDNEQTESLLSSDQTKQSYSSSLGDNVFIWRSPTSARNTQAKRAFESLMSIYVKTPTGKQYTYFAKNLSDLANSDFIRNPASKATGNSKRTQIAVNPYLASFYDCLQIYGNALNNSLSSIEMAQDQNSKTILRENLHANLSNFMRNVRYENMLTGTIYLDEKGDRATDYTLDDMNQMTGKFWPVILFKGETRDIERLARIQWSSDDKGK